MAKRLILLSLLLGGCGPIVPAATPAQLLYTPGPPVVVTTQEYISQDFSVHYPAGWQVITSPAFSETWVVFTNEQAIIALATNPDDIRDLQPIADIQPRQTTQTIEDITALLIADENEWDIYYQQFQAILESIVRPSAYEPPRAEA